MSDQRGRVVWLYCVTDEFRRVVKVGISRNVPRRAWSLSSEGRAFMNWCGLTVHGTHPRMLIVRTWSLGNITTPEAMSVEAVAHATLRELAPMSHGEWFHIGPRRTVKAIELACREHLRAEAA